jgi:hypothetical protein
LGSLLLFPWSSSPRVEFSLGRVFSSLVEFSPGRVLP